MDEPTTPQAVARISAEDVAKVAALARLRLGPGELDRFTHQLADILAHAEDIEALDLADVEPMAHPVRLRNVFRSDEPAPPLDRDTVLGQAPSAEDGMFCVPPVLGEAP
ncbi:MAG: Asp-tRNA(Asn)/Glu-tRNA(Gln) amidotransferase subunit GatC [Actinobacteria bacterium]|nr:Asp-tRNA(Asn)/Glu-tRNA(Gln) amidotransferase subunit GatC [Actinomycetota bacterium]